MVRKIRYRQVLRNRHSQKGRYLKEVSQQKSFWREDKAPTPTIEKVRELHRLLGTWDNSTYWVSIVSYPSKEVLNRLFVNGGEFRIYPKAQYRPLKKHQKWYEKNVLWKEQEKRALEFFEREGC